MARFGDSYLHKISLTFVCLLHYSVYKNEYQEARECINKAREQHCNFQQEVLDTTASITNPFCTSRGITNRLSTMLQLVVSVVSLLFFFTVK